MSRNVVAAQVDGPDAGIVVPDQSLDRQRLRADTPACAHLTHLNNAGAGLPPRQVTERVVNHLYLEEQVGGYEAAERVTREWADGKEALGRLLGTSARNVAVVESTTVAFHRILSTVPLRRGDRVLLAGAEYAGTVLPLLQLARRIGLRLEFLPDGPDGTVDAAAVSRTLDDDVRLVCAVHAPSQNGLVNDVAAVGAALAGSRAWYVVDACQSLGQLPVDASGFQADFVVASGRKYLRGPRGTGVLAVGDRALRELDAFPVDVRGADWVHTDEVTLAESAERYETFERSVAAGLGLMAAARYALDTGIDALAAAIGRNAEYLRARIGALPGWRVLDRGTRRSGIVVCRHDWATPPQVHTALRQERINAHVVSPTTNPRDLGDRAALRLSPHAFTNQADLDRALAVLARF